MLGDKPSCLVAPYNSDRALCLLLRRWRVRGGPHRVNLQTGTDEGIVETTEDISEISISADGSIFMAANSTAVLRPFGPGRCCPGAIGRADPNFRSHQSPRRLRTYYPDPYNQYCAFGQQLFSADLSRSVANLNATPVCFFPDRPIFFTLDGDKLSAYSYNTFKQLDTVTIDTPADPNAPNAVRRRGQPRVARLQPNRTLVNTQVLCDVKNGKIVVCAGDNASVIALADLNLPKEPLLNVAVEGEGNASFGKELSFKLVAGDRTAKVELHTGPTGMKLLGDKLTWNPVPGDVGTAKIVLRVFAGDGSDCRNFVLTIRRNSIDLPFSPDEMELARDGKSAVIMSRALAAGAEADISTTESARDVRPGGGRYRKTHHQR